MLLDEELVEVALACDCVVLDPVPVLPLACGECVLLDVVPVCATLVGEVDVPPLAAVVVVVPWFVAVVALCCPWWRPVVAWDVAVLLPVEPAWVLVDVCGAL